MGHRQKVASYDVFKGLTDKTFIGAIAVIVCLTSYPTVNAHLTHDFKNSFVGDFCSQLSAQTHGYLSVTAAVCGTREDLCNRVV